MFSLKMKQLFAASVSLLILGASSVVAGAPATGREQIPNPIVSYGTYGSAARVLGFAPLTLSRDSGYTPEGYSVIGGRSADLSFLRLGQPEAKVRIRTALKKEISKEELSGIYGAEWNKQRINETNMEIAQLGPQSYAARWETGNYVFAVQGQGMEPAAFSPTAWWKIQSIISRPSKRIRKKAGRKQFTVLYKKGLLHAQQLPF